jgi:hypothetical protein
LRNQQASLPNSNPCRESQQPRRPRGDHFPPELAADTTRPPARAFPPTKKLEELVLSERLAHAGHPVLRWMAGNASLETDAADIWKPSKKKSIERIDGIVTLIMAVGIAMHEPGPRWGLFYDTHPVEFM